MARLSIYFSVLAPFLPWLPPCVKAMKIASHYALRSSQEKSKSQDDHLLKLVVKSRSWVFISANRIFCITFVTLVGAFDILYGGCPAGYFFYITKIYFLSQIHVVPTAHSSSSTWEWNCTTFSYRLFCTSVMMESNEPTKEAFKSVM